MATPAEQLNLEQLKSDLAMIVARARSGEHEVWTEEDELDDQRFGEELRKDIEAYEKQPPKTLEEMHMRLRNEANHQDLLRGFAASEAQMNLELAMLDANTKAEEQKEAFEEQLQAQGKKLEEIWKNMYLPEKQYQAKMRKIASNPIEFAYFDTARRELKKELNIMETLSSTKVKRGTSSFLDFLAIGIHHAADYLPAPACGVVKSGAKVVQAVSDARELHRNNQGINNAAYDTTQFAEEVALGLIEYCFNGGINSKDSAVKIAKKHIGEVIEALKSKPSEDFAGFTSQQITLANQVINLLITLDKLPTANSAQQHTNGKPITHALGNHQNKEKASLRERIFGKKERKEPAIVAAKTFATAQPF